MLYDTLVTYHNDMKTSPTGNYDITNENVSQTSAVAGEVTQEITGINQMAEEIKTGSNQVNGSSSELAKLAETLNEMVNRFKI